MFHYYQDKLTIEAAALYNKPLYDELQSLHKAVQEALAMEDEAKFRRLYRGLQEMKQVYKEDEKTFLTFTNYKQKMNRGQVHRLQRGCKGRMALIEWASLEPILKARIIKHIGYDPAREHRQRRFADFIVKDRKAEAYFKEVKKADGEGLSEGLIEKYTNKARILNAIKQYIEDRENLARVKSKTMFWQNMAVHLSSLTLVHGLPKHGRRLQQVYSRYLKEGYQSLLPGKLGNANRQKLKGAAADWWLAAYAQPHKPSLPYLMSVYEQLRMDKDWPVLTERGVHRFLQQPENKRLWMLGRDGKAAYERVFQHHIKRKKQSWFPNAYWAIDGTKLDLLYVDLDKDGKRKLLAKLKIDIVVDMYSEKILGWSVSETEDHKDHFKALKMALQHSGARPYLLHYDNQSGHKSGRMQELYDKIVANHGAHYASKPYTHSSPVEQVLKRLQQQVIGRFWFSDKQSPTVRRLENKPNMEFIKQNMHQLPNKLGAIRAWEVAVKLWNEARHPKQELSRTQVYAEEAPIREEFSFLDMVEIFWLTAPRRVTYRRGGLLFTVLGKEHEYEVLDGEGKIDSEFTRKYVGAKFWVKYDPEHLSEFIQLYKEDEAGRRTFIANAQPKRLHESVPVLMSDGDKKAWEADYALRDLELVRDRKALEEIRQRAGIDAEQLPAEQELLLKQGGMAPKKERQEGESYVYGF